MVNLGYESYLGIAKETVYGSYQAPELFIPVKSLDIKQDVAWIERKSELRTKRFGYVPVQGRKSVAGQFVINGYPNMMGLLLANFFGDASVTATVPGAVYTHKWIPGTSVGRQLSITGRVGNANPNDIAGWKTNELDLSIDNEGLLQVTCIGGAKSRVEGTAEAVTYVETTPFTFWQAVLTDTTAGATLYADTASVKMINNYKLDNFKISGGQTTVEPVFQGRPTFEGSFTIDFENYTMYDRFQNFTNCALTLVFTSLDVINGVHTYTLTITLPLIRYKQNQPSATSPDKISITCDYEAFEGTMGGDSAPIKVELKSGDATY